MNNDTMFRMIGASNHCEDEREENDYYATSPIATKALIDREVFNHLIWEPACGGGHICDVLKNAGYDVIASDLVDRGYPKTIVYDFLSNSLWDNNKPIITGNFDIITNPPYKYANEFVDKALSLVNVGCKVAMFLKLAFLESQTRYEMFMKNPPKYVYVFSNRVVCAKNGDFYQRDVDGNIKKDNNGNPLMLSSAMAYAWFVWEKGYKGDTVIRWICEK